jgi:hypothetical protein
MSPVVSFFVGLALTLITALVVVFYLKTPLRHILCDLCGTEQRADFWTAFSNVVLILLPIIFALTRRPTGGSGSEAFFEITDQLLWAFVGLLLAVFVLGFFISIFILKDPRQRKIEAPNTQYGPTT